MDNLLKRVEKIFFILGLIYFTEPFLPFTTSSVAIDVFSSADKLPVVEDSRPLLILRIFFLGITFFLTLVNSKRIIYLALKRKFFLVFIALYPLSFLWSIVPDETLRKGIIVIGCVLFGFNLADRYSLRDQLFILAWSMGILAVGSLLFTLAMPSLGIESGEHAGAWRGLFPQKNPFSRTMVLSAITILLAAMESYSHHKIIWFGLGLSVLLILLSTAKSALVLFLFLLILMQLFRMLRWNNSIALPIFIIMVLIVGGISIFLASNTESIVRFLGRDITLTGRTGIWAVVISKIMKHLWFGYGYKGFWLGMQGDSADVWYETLGFMSPNSHNGFLDIAVELGLVGLFFFLLTYSKNYFRALTWLRLKVTAVGLFPIMFLTYMLLYNITESTIDAPPITLVLYSSITTSVLTEFIPVQDSKTSADRNLKILLKENL
jgi:O-antigen ligase